MWTFRDFLVEHPHETDSTVPTCVYLHQPVELDRPVEAIYADVRAGIRQTQTLRLPIASFIPTQTHVNNTKVMVFGVFGMYVDHLPVVYPQDDGLFWIVDGHHHICGAVTQG